ncbi:MAG: AAA family ATPase [Bacilli bacterium]|nr:AAA family ATPase [Bacilli bacterium]
MQEIYIITGRTGAGKSTLCKKLAEFLEYPLLSFANMGKDFANKNGFKRIRECHLAMELSEFKTRMADHILSIIEDELTRHEKVIIDGLYIDTVVFKLKEKYNCKLIYLNTDDEIRYQRVAERLAISIEQAQEENKIKERLKDEVGIRELIKTADYILDGNLSIEEIFNNCCNIIKES